MVTIAFFVKTGNLEARLKRYEVAIAAAAGPPDAKMLAGVDAAVSAIQTRNFDTLRRGAWRTISFLTVLLSRQNIGAIGTKAGSFAEGNSLAARIGFLRPLHDKGGLRRSLKRGDPQHYAKIAGNTIRIGTLVPYAWKHLRGGSATFSDGHIEYERVPHQYKSKKTGKTWSGTKIVPSGAADSRIRRLVAKPSKENNFFANRLRKYLADHPTRTATIPKRSWIRKFDGSDRKLIVATVMAAVEGRLTAFLKGRRRDRRKAELDLVIEQRNMFRDIVGGGEE